MSHSHSLTREEYCLGSRCPLLLWRTRNDSNSAVSRYSEHETAAVNNARAAKMYAKLHGAVFVPDEKGAAELTQSYINSGERFIANAFFDTGTLSARPDLLRRTAKGWALYTIRAAAHIRQQFIKDTAYQIAVLSQCGVKVTRAFAVHINTEADMNSDEFLQAADITGRAFSEWERAGRRAKNLCRMLDEGSAPSALLHQGCLIPTDCPMHDECFSALPSPNVFDLSGLAGQIKFRLYGEGKTSFEDVCKDKAVSPLQKKRIRMALDGVPPVIDREGIREFLGTLWYPVCFLDFESFQTPFPPFDGIRPFEPVAFQFSLHTVAEKGAKPVHTGLIVPPGEDPREAIARRLVSDIPRGACVVAYNMQFEKMILSSLAKQFLPLSAELSERCNNVRDMMYPFRKKYYYHPKMYGSYSLKSVMRALFPDIKELDYSLLPGIHNGSQAAAAYALCADGVSGIDSDAVVRSLDKYCALDTFSLVKLLELLESTQETEQQQIKTEIE